MVFQVEFCIDLGEYYEQFTNRAISSEFNVWRDVKLVDMYADCIEREEEESVHSDADTTTSFIPHHQLRYHWSTEMFRQNPDGMESIIGMHVFVDCKD